MYIYNKDGKDYLGYHSHPLLADSDGDGLADGEDDNKKHGMSQIVIPSFLWSWLIVMMITLTKF